MEMHAEMASLTAAVGPFLADTNGSQFFIAYTKLPHLNMKYPILGKVISGWETLDVMEKMPVGQKDRPEEPMVLKSCTIHANPFADVAF